MIMENVSFTIISAVIAACSACVGALIPSVFSYLAQKKINDDRRKIMWEELRRNEYCQYIESLQLAMNESNEDNIRILQNATNRLLLYSGNKLTMLSNQYFKKLIDSANTGEFLTYDEQVKYHTEIVNEMRNEMGNENKTLDSVILVVVPRKR